tara:strand:- start:323 stop:703 length:381 start_codon:yes stop_codon:yes gene_type:complete
MAYVVTLTFNYDINTSLQVGDQVYKTTTTSLGGFEQNLTATPTHIGEVSGFPGIGQVEVLSEYVDSTGLALPANYPVSADYISFSKNRVVNNNDLLGYHASVHFANNSTTAAKLWSVGSGVTENSK